eukprot:1873900-Rhodomonas_salina.1
MEGGAGMEYAGTNGVVLTLDRAVQGMAPPHGYGTNIHYLTVLLSKAYLEGKVRIRRRSRRERRMEDEDGGWRMEDGGWRMEDEEEEEDNDDDDANNMTTTTTTMAKMTMKTGR